MKKGTRSTRKTEGEKVSDLMIKLSARLPEKTEPPATAMNDKRCSYMRECEFVNYSETPITFVCQGVKRLGKTNIGKVRICSQDLLMERCQHFEIPIFFGRAFIEDMTAVLDEAGRMGLER